MPSLGRLPPEIFEEILYLLALDGTALLSLRNTSRSYHDVVDLAMPSLAWRIAGISTDRDRADLSWIEQQIYDQLEYIRLIYWNRGFRFPTESWIPSAKVRKRQRTNAKIKAPGYRFGYPPPNNNNWLLESTDDLSSVLSMFEDKANNVWFDDGDLPKMLAFFEDSFSNPISCCGEEHAWWNIPSCDNQFVLRNIREFNHISGKAPYRSFSRIRGLAKLRNVCDHLFRILKRSKSWGKTVVDHLGVQGFLDYQPILFEELYWAKAPYDVRSVRLKLASLARTAGLAITEARTFAMTAVLDLI
ncbi:MAG: hypothetical protein M1820_003357 [Bogoriella megaspora]|nr:MAG: hypothetical protein M1820_003357 [Bogoriella megaspora]